MLAKNNINVILCYFNSKCYVTEWVEHPNSTSFSCKHLEKGHSHSDLRQLFLREIQWMIDGSDSVFVQVSSFGQVCTEDGVVGHIHERNHCMPALIVVPYL